MAFLFTTRYGKDTTQYKHGAYKTKLYYIWIGMKQRCSNKNNTMYPYYGGRGISVCAEWITNFILFREWAFSTGYVEGCLLTG